MPDSLTKVSSPVAPVAASSVLTTPSEQPMAAVPVGKVQETLAGLGLTLTDSLSSQELGTALYQNLSELTNSADNAKLALVFAAFANKTDSLPTPALRFLAKVSGRINPADFRLLLESMHNYSENLHEHALLHTLKEYQIDILGAFVETFGVTLVQRVFGKELQEIILKRLMEHPSEDLKKACRIILQETKLMDLNSLVRWCAFSRLGDEKLLALVEICLESNPEAFLQQKETLTFLIDHAARNGMLQSLETLCNELLEKDPKFLRRHLRSTKSPLLAATKNNQGPTLSYLIGVTKKFYPNHWKTILPNTETAYGENLLYWAVSPYGDTALTTLKNHIDAKVLQAMGRRCIHKKLPLFLYRVANGIRDPRDPQRLRYPSTEALIYCYDLLTKGQKAKVKLWLSAQKPEFFSRIAQYAEPGVFEFLYSLVADQLSVETLFSGYAVESLVHRAVQNPQGAKPVLDLLRKQDTTFIQNVLTPKGWFTTPLQLAVSHGSPDCIRDLAEMMVHMGGPKVQPCGSQTSILGSPLLLAIRRKSLDKPEEAVRTTIEVLKTYWPEHLEKVVKTATGGDRPLCQALDRHFSEILSVVTALYLEDYPEAIPALLISNGRGSETLRRLTSSHQGPETVAKLLDKLTNKQIEQALSVKGVNHLIQSDAICGLLKRRFPEPGQRLKILMRARRLDRTLQFTPGARIRDLLGGESIPPAYARILYSSDENANANDIYPDLAKIFGTKLDEFNAQGETELSQYYWTKSRDLYLKLALHEYTTEEVAQLTPYFERILNLRFLDQQKQFMEIIMQLIPRKDLLIPSDNLQAIPPKQPILHRISLQYLKYRGGNADLVDKLLEYIKENSSSLSPTSAAGREFLLSIQILAAVALSDSHNTNDLNAILVRTANGDTLEELRAVYQLWHHDPKMLKAAELNKHDSIQACAFNIFVQLLRLGSVEDYENKYQAFAERIREPTSLISYATQMSRHEWLMGELETCMRQVLEGTFQDDRYAEAGNPFLRELYEQSDELKPRLRTASQDVRSFNVGEPVAASLKKLILQDQKRSKDDFKRIHAFLPLLNGEGEIADKDKAEAKEIRKCLGIKLGKLKKELRKQKIDRMSHPEYLRLFLELHLISACLRKDMRQAKSDLEMAITCAKELEKKPDQFTELIDFQMFGDFIKTLEGLQTSLSIAKYKVSLTDDFWDLMRCGTDVVGSCQSLTCPSGMQACLLGYVRNGFVLPIVVKKPSDKEPGKQYIEARRLLVITLDKHNKPALFLEAPYRNDSNPAIDEAMVQMARNVANHLGMPLYSKSVAAEGEKAHLWVGKGISKYIYSDSAAARGPQQSGFDIPGATLLYNPSKEASCAIPSSSVSE